MTEESWQILIVEDEPELGAILQDYLRQAGMGVTLLREGTGAVETILETRPDLVVLDLMLPGKDGLSICREVRAVSDVPIILETAKVEEIDRLLGLELGADDYLCKPFSPRELVARVKAILRRVSAHRAALAAMARAPSDTLPQTGHLQMDKERWVGAVNGCSLNLTRREFELLLVLHERPGRVFSRAQLLEMAFPDDHDVYDRTIDSHIKNIRQKIKVHLPEEEVIRSVYGVGYAYDAFS